MNIRAKESGFTVVELLIVIIVIGILAVLALNALGTSQARARDAERITDVRALHKALEAYYTTNSNYPHQDNLDASIFDGLNPESLSDPFGYEINATDSTYTYATTGCSGTSYCTGYTITADLERDEDAYTVDSIN